jgi:hypothetical protein
MLIGDALLTADPLPVGMIPSPPLSLDSGSFDVLVHQRFHAAQGHGLL